MIKYYNFLIALVILSFLCDLHAQENYPYYVIPQGHIRTDNGISYEISLGLKSNKEQKIERSDFFYKSDGEKTIIYNSWLKYGFINGIYPCSPDCNTELYAHTEQGVSLIKILDLVVDSQDVCGEQQTLIWVEHKRLEGNLLFVSTMKGTKENSFIKALNLKVEKWPDFINEDSLRIPAGFKNKEITLYKYGDNDAYIAEVHGTGWFESVDEVKFGPSKEGKWTGIYYVDKNGAKIITPVHHIMQSYYGQDFSFRGLEDINADGELDIIIGNPVVLVLERFKDGFRSWGFAYFPPGGC